ncbi:hypothetical protein [Streptomyces antimycoticus]|uniref:hypothetical protein n=1 Tax=Streptomyces antimycoticus TaxID=68175 RepID=UPI0036BA5131
MPVGDHIARHRVHGACPGRFLTGASFQPRRPGGPTWREFLTAQAEDIIACDFLYVALIDLPRAYVLMFLEHGAHRLHIASVTADPTVTIDRVALQTICNRAHGHLVAARVHLTGPPTIDLSTVLSTWSTTSEMRLYSDALQ